MAQANDWVINVREIAAADGKTNGTKYGSLPSIHLSYLIFSFWKSKFSTTLVLVVLASLLKQWVTIMIKSFPVVHDRRQKTGWRRRIVTKEDLAAEERRLRQRLGWAPVLGPCLSRIPLQRSSIFINCNDMGSGVKFGSLWQCQDSILVAGEWRTSQRFWKPASLFQPHFPPSQSVGDLKMVRT